MQLTALHNYKHAIRLRICRPNCRLKGNSYAAGDYTDQCISRKFHDSLSGLYSSQVDVKLSFEIPIILGTGI